MKGLLPLLSQESKPIMSWELAKLAFRLTPTIFSFLILRGWQKIWSYIQHRQFVKVDHPKNIIIMGGSFAGISLVMRLCELAQSGYRVILVEPHSHFHWIFNFPRFSVLGGQEKKAFIPYDNLGSNAPAGVYQLIKARVVKVNQQDVELDTGDLVPYAFLVFCTGSAQPSPAHLAADERSAACRELQDSQNTIKKANNIAVIGAGAVGIEVATDIKSFYPEKDVILFHSRRQILNGFGPRLQEYALQALKRLEITVVLGERPTQSHDRSTKRGKSLLFSDGHIETFDTIVSYA